MSAGNWVLIGCLAFIVLAIVLGIRKGKRNYTGVLSQVAAEAHAQGAAEATAALQAALTQTVTVVAGNTGRTDDAGAIRLSDSDREIVGVLERIRAGLAVPDLSERQGLSAAERLASLPGSPFPPPAVDGDGLYRREAHLLDGYPGRHLVEIPPVDHEQDAS